MDSVAAAIRDTVLVTVRDTVKDTVHVIKTMDLPQPLLVKEQGTLWIELLPSAVAVLVFVLTVIAGLHKMRRDQEAHIKAQRELIKEDVKAKTYTRVMEAISSYEAAAADLEAICQNAHEQLLSCFKMGMGTPQITATDF